MKHIGLAAIILAMLMGGLVSGAVGDGWGRSEWGRCQSNSAFGDSLWSATFGGSVGDHCYSVIQTADGGFALAGITQSFIYGSLGYNIWLVRLNANGDSLWSRAYGVTDHDNEAFSVIENPNGEFILTGYITNYPGYGPDVFCLVKVDANGDSLDSRVYGGANSEQSWNSIPTSDNGYVLVGYTKSIGIAGCRKGWILKLDSAIDSVWADTTGVNAAFKNTEIWGVAEALNGDYVCGGFTNQAGGPGGYDFYAVRKNATGDTTRWAKRYGGASDDYCYTLAATSDDCFVLSGYTKSFTYGYEDFWLVKIDADGDTLWTRHYGGVLADICYSIIENDADELMLAGKTNSFGPGNASYWLLKVSSAGDSLWSQAYGGNGGDDICRDVIQTTDGDYILTGYTENYGAGGNDFWLLRVGEAETKIDRRLAWGRGAWGR